MISGALLERIRKLIEEGYNTDENLETISFEYDIKIEDLQAIRAQINQEKNNMQTSKQITTSTKNGVHTQGSIKVESPNVRTEYYTKRTDAESGINKYNISKKCALIRKNYYSLYEGEEVGEGRLTTTKPQTKISEKVEEAIKKMKINQEDASIDYIDKIKKLLKIVDSIQKETFSVEQADEIIAILGDINFDQAYKYAHVIRTYKNFANNQLIKAIEAEINNATDIDRLKVLKSKLSGKEIQNHLLVEAVKMRIDSKIIKLKSTQVKVNKKNTISENMQNIVSNITAGNCNKVVIKQLLEDEIKKRMKEAPNTKFTLNEKQQRTQIYYELVKLYEEQAEKYKIQNPEETVRILEEIFAVGFESSLRAVVKNFIAQKEYKKAEELCNNFSAGLEEFSESASSILRLREEIKRAEIGSIIVRGIRTTATDEEFSRFFNVIGERLSSEGYSLKLIPLGKSKDGSRNITLEDVWYDKSINQGRE